MARENLILTETYQFAIRVTALARHLRERKEYDFASQLWRSGTSIGANVEEAQAAQSRADFASKMAIAAKEARETRFWLRLAVDAHLVDVSEVSGLSAQIETILKILTSIVKTALESEPSKIQNPKSNISIA